MKKILILIGIIFVFIFNLAAFHSEEDENILLLSPFTQSKKTNKLKGKTNLKEDLRKFLLIYDFFIDENYLIDEVKDLALEKSLIENYNSLKYIYKYAKDKNIALAIKPPIFDFIMNEINYDEKKSNQNNLKHSDIVDRFLTKNFTLEDQKIILNNLRLFPRNTNVSILQNKKIFDFYNSYKNLKINYEILNSKEEDVYKNYVQSLGLIQSFYLEALVFYNILWLDETSLKNEKIIKIIEDEDRIDIEDLIFINKLKNDYFREAMNFFMNLPKKWEYLAYPFHCPRFDILASNSMNKYFLDFKFNIDLQTDASWHVAKSFKTINNFYMQFDKKFIEHKYPSGIITSLDYIDKNIQKTLAVRDHEIIINKGNYLDYSPVILKNSSTNKNIYLFFENIDFDQTRGYDIDYFIKNFIKKIVLHKDKDNQNMKFIFTINKEKLFNFGIKETEYFYREFFSELSMKNRIELISINELKKDLKMNEIDLNEQEFIINNEKLVSLLTDNICSNYWFLIKILRNELDNKKNKKEIDINIYLECLHSLYEIESNLFLDTFLHDNIKSANLKNQIKIFFNKFFSDFDIDIKSILSKYNFNSLIPFSEKIEEFSRILFYNDKKAFKIEESLNDDYGDGNYLYPKNGILKKGALDIKSFYVEEKDDNLIFRIDFKKSNDFIDPIKNKQIDIYIDVDKLENSGNLNLFENRNAFFEANSGWEYAISINEDDVELFEYKNEMVYKIGTLDITVDNEENSIFVFCPKNLLNDFNIFYCGYGVMTLGYNDINKSIIKVNSNISRNSFYGRTDLFQANIIDLILPNTENQNKILGAKFKIAKLPLIYPQKKEL